MRNKVQQEIDNEFRRWLVPSNWEGEGQLQAVNHQRYDGTLSWVFKIPELKSWLESQPGSY
jgi:hypothetical protein